MCETSKLSRPLSTSPRRNVNVIEHRSILEIRRTDRRLAGLAAPFNVPTEIADFREVILPGAFRETLRSGRDVTAVVDHDMTKLLARTKSGTLKLSEGVKG